MTTIECICTKSTKLSGVTTLNVINRALIALCKFRRPGYTRSLCANTKQAVSSMRILCLTHGVCVKNLPHCLEDSNDAAPQLSCYKHRMGLDGIGIIPDENSIRTDSTLTTRHGILCALLLIFVLLKILFISSLETRSRNSCMTLLVGCGLICFGIFMLFRSIALDEHDHVGRLQTLEEKMLLDMFSLGSGSHGKTVKVTSKTKTFSVTIAHHENWSGVPVETELNFVATICKPLI